MRRALTGPAWWQLIAGLTIINLSVTYAAIYPWIAR